MGPGCCGQQMVNMSDEDFQRDYRNTIGLFATGVTVVLAAKEGDVRGMTANAVTSLSLDPTLLLFCPAKDARISSYCEIGSSFTVNILGAHQERISNHFAGDDTEPEPVFVEWDEAGDAPRIAGSLACIGCKTRAIHDGGDHWIVVGEVVALHQDSDPAEPLLFHAGSSRRLTSD